MLNAPSVTSFIRSVGSVIVCDIQFMVVLQLNNILRFSMLTRYEPERQLEVSILSCHKLRGTIWLNVTLAYHIKALFTVC